MKKFMKDIRMILSGSIGNVMEWYDFAVYGYFAKVLAPLFFPSEDKAVALISVFGVFAAGFIMRPVGAIIFGYIGDKLGRKKALLVSVVLMAVATALLGFLPTYAQIGVFAPILLTLLRLIQGVSVGGELTTSISFIVEVAPANRRGFYGAWTTFSAVAGILLGSAVGALVESLFTTEQIEEWVWRLPFILGILLGGYGLVMRKGLKEPESFLKAKESGELLKSPLLYALKNQYKTILLIIGLLWIFSAGFYMPFIYLPTYLSAVEHIPLSFALDINSLAMVILLGLILFMGYLSDRIGRKKVIMFGALGFLVLAYPIFSLLNYETHIDIFTALIIMAIFTSALQGAIPAFLSENFSTRVRVSAMSFSYNIALALFGGTTPLVATYLIKETGSSMAPGYYLMFAALVSILCLLGLKETYKKVLD